MRPAMNNHEHNQEYWLFIKRERTGLLGFAYLISFITFPSRSCMELMKLLIFCLKNFPVTQEIPLDRWIEMECFQQTLSAKNLLSHCIPSKIALTAVCLPFGQPTYFERVLWNIRVTFLSYCVLRQNPLDWENGGYCSHNLKTEQESKDIQHRCSPQDAMRMGRCLGGGG